MNQTDYAKLASKLDDWSPSGFDDGEGGPKPEVHPLARFVEFDGVVKPPRWLIPGFIPYGVAVISGSAGVGKTTALIPLAMTVAGLHGDADLMPRHWRHVIYITEDVEQAHRIMAGMVNCANLGISLEQVKDRFHIVEAARLDPAYVATVGQTYRDKFTRVVAGIDVFPLAVIDTKSAVFALENENDNSETSRMMAALKQKFAGLPVWLIGHVAKANIGRSDVASLSNRGAGASDSDGNQTLFLINENDRRYLVKGKVRFEPRWQELEIVSYTDRVTVPDEFGYDETITLRWGIATPPALSRKDAAKQAEDEQQLEDDAAMRDSIRNAVQEAWQAGNPLNRTGVKSKLRKKSTEVFDTIQNLLSEQWLHEVSVPAQLRTNNNRTAFLVNFTTEEHEAAISGAGLPADKLVIPASWCKAEIPSVPKRKGNPDEKSL